MKTCVCACFNHPPQYLESDPHELIEGHLPSVCPLSMVEAVVISKEDLKALGREARKKLKERFAKGSTLFVCKSGDKREVLEVASRLATRAEAPEEGLEAGLYFTLEAEFGNDHVLPLAFESAGSGVVTFRARGQEFQIALLAENRPLTETNSQDAVLVRVGPLSKGLKVTFHRGDKTPPRLVASDMLWGCDLDAYIHFKIAYTAGQGVQLTNYANGQSVFYSDPSAAGLRFVSVSCWKKAVSFKGFFLK